MEDAGDEEFLWELIFTLGPLLRHVDERLLECDETWGIGITRGRLQMIMEDLTDLFDKHIDELRGIKEIASEIVEGLYGDGSEDVDGEDDGNGDIHQWN